jgi:hypothetical protein
MGEIFAILGAYLVVVLAIAILMIASMWKLFSKAGQPGWASIVPIYNYVVMLQIIKKPIWWLIIILFVPFVNFIFIILMFIELAKAYGKSAGFGVGMILLPYIFFPMLAFGDSKYVYGDKAQPTSDLLDN